MCCVPRCQTLTPRPALMFFSESHTYNRLLRYRRERAWWEVVVALRKIAVVTIGTFGALLGVVDLQAFLALLIVFISIVTHLLGKPFDQGTPALKRLHDLEFVALCVCWCTFWGGLIFFLGREKAGSVPEWCMQGMSVLLVMTNLGFLLASGAMFVRAYLQDRRKAKRRRATKLAAKQQQQQQQTAALTRVVPVQAGRSSSSVAEAAVEVEKDEDRDDEEEFDRHARSVHEEYDKHEKHLQRAHSQRQEHARRKTQLRLIARMQIKQTRALQRVPAFSRLDADAISKIVDVMAYSRLPPGTVLCREGEPSDEFFVCVAGSCAVTVRKGGGNGRGEDGNGGEVFRLGTIRSLQFFGETAFEARSSERATRGATVTAESEVQVLSLHRGEFEALVARGVLTLGVIQDVRTVRAEREAGNRRLLQGEAKEDKREQAPGKRVSLTEVAL